MFDKKKQKKISPDYAVLAALAVIEDDLGDSVPLEEIVFSLRADFKIKMGESKIANILQKFEKDGYVKKNEQKKYSITSKSGEIADDFIEAQNI